MKIIFLAISFFVFLFGNTNSKIAYALKFNAYKHSIDQRIIYTLAKIESGFDNNIITFVSEKKWDIRGGNNIKINNLKYKNKFLVQVKGEVNSLKKIALFFIKKGYKVDIGLMQVNSQNFNLNELNLIFDLNYNITKAINILKSCRAKFGNIKDSIECYNKGTKIGKKYDYYNRFLNHFIKDFG